MYLDTAQTSSPTTLLRKSSQHFRLALRMDLLSALFASLTAAALAPPLLLHRSTRPNWCLLFRISSFHHLLERAQMVTFLTWASRREIKEDWTNSISSSGSSLVALSLRQGRSPTRCSHKKSSLGLSGGHSSSFSFSSRFPRAQLQPRI